MTDDEIIDGELSFMGTGQLLIHHKPEQCRGRHCCFHNPSDHHMVSWPLHYRTDKPPLIERICEHNFGHPDPDCIEYLSSFVNGPHPWGAHGCDGCCVG